MRALEEWKPLASVRSKPEVGCRRRIMRVCGYQGYTFCGYPTLCQVSRGVNNPKTRSPGSHTPCYPPSTLKRPNSGLTLTAAGNFHSPFFHCSHSVSLSPDILRSPVRLYRAFTLLGLPDIIHWSFQPTSLSLPCWLLPFREVTLTVKLNLFSVCECVVNYFIK